MKTLKLFLISSILFGGLNASSQTTGMDFNIVDCNGSPQHLFADLDAGQVVIIEFFMTSCGSCVVAGDALEAMKTDLLVEFPGMIKSYSFGYNNSYSCATVNGWVTTNGYSSIPSDSGAAQVAYYGGFGMPTIVILGGTSHDILGTTYVGFSISDTTAMAQDIRDFFGTAGIESSTQIANMNIYPNPANNAFQLDFTLLQESDVAMELVDMSGRVILTMPTEQIAAGFVTRTINVSDIQTGNYLLRLSVNGTIEHHKLTVTH